MRAHFDRGAVERFRSLVRQQLGLLFDESKLDWLGEVLRHRLDALGEESCAGYLDRLAANGPGEMRALAEQLTVGETYFFRNPDQFRALIELVLPEVARARAGSHRLRILSAGCSSGEEAYSIALLLREHLAELASWDVKVLGVDLNPAAIARARAGVFTPWSLRQTTPEQQRHFRETPRGFQLDESVRALVSFEEGNLAAADCPLWQPGAFDVVFCRNVTMYFAPEVVRAVIDRIASSLAAGGYLFLGHAETLRGVSQQFHLRHTHDTFYYQARGSAQPFAAPVDPPMAAALVPASSDDSWVQTITRASERVATLTARPVAGPGDLAARPAPAGHSPELGRALELVRHERFAEASSVLGAPRADGTDDPDTQLLRAVLLTNTGEPAEAERLCRRVLEADELNAAAHYLMALCREHAGDAHGAADHDQAAIYLDPGFAMPRLHRGLMAARGGDAELARRELGDALLLLPREDGARVLLLGGGFSRDALIELCRAQLRASGGRG